MVQVRKDTSYLENIINNHFSHCFCTWQTQVKTLQDKIKTTLNYRLQLLGLCRVPLDLTAASALSRIPDCNIGRIAWMSSGCGREIATAVNIVARDRERVSGTRRDTNSTRINWRILRPTRFYTWTTNNPIFLKIIRHYWIYCSFTVIYWHRGWLRFINFWYTL